MKKRTLIIIAIILLIILLLIILAYFFYPGCAFHRLGSSFEGRNEGEICYCKIKDGYCMLEGVYAGEITDAQQEEIDRLFGE